VLKDIDEWTRSDLNHAMKFFVAEIRKENGELYPPQTLKSIVAMVQHHFVHERKMDISFFKDREFVELRDVLDGCMKDAAKKGLVQLKRKSEVITVQEEEKLWSNGSLGCSNGRQLLETLIYLLGMNLSLRASQEHRDLEFGENSQLQMIKEGEEEVLLYVERTSKNHSFGLKSTRMEPKCTKIYPNRLNAGRCVVSMYKKYISHRPESHGQSGHLSFYLTPIAQPKSDVWYKSQPFGIHSVEKVTKKLMASLGGDGVERYSNSSLRRTCYNRLLTAGVPREMIAKKTGRISGLADMDYVSLREQERAMSHIVSGGGTSDGGVAPRSSIAGGVSDGGVTPRSSIAGGVSDGGVTPRSSIAGGVSDGGVTPRYSMAGGVSDGGGDGVVTLDGIVSEGGDDEWSFLDESITGIFLLQ
jgi:hypothetical protein